MNSHISRLVRPILFPTLWKSFSMTITKYGIYVTTYTNIPLLRLCFKSLKKVKSHIFSDFIKASFSFFIHYHEFRLLFLSSASFYILCYVDVDFLSWQHSHNEHQVTVVPCPSSGRSPWRLSSSPSADVCRWSRTLTLCSVQTGWSTSPHPPSTARCAPRRPQTLWCSAPAASDSSPAACPGWWSGWLFDHVLPSSFCLLYASRCRIDVCSVLGAHFSFFF